MSDVQAGVTIVPESARSEPEKIQDFIFGRELSEIYLLLDHISGRSDKRLDDGSKTAGGADPVSIKEICEIGWPWPPLGNGENKAAQAAQLIRAKDWLNAAARPATGMTVAFTLLVVGDEQTGLMRSFLAWLRLMIHSGLTRAVGAAPHPSSVPRGEGGQPWPTRVSLSQTAFPGLVEAAFWFKYKLWALVAVLIAGFALTCCLSWEVAVGNDILAHMDTIHARRTSLHKEIAAGEDAMAAKKQAATPAPAPDATQVLAAARLQASLAELAREHAMENILLDAWVSPWRWTRLAERRAQPRPADGAVPVHSADGVAPARFTEGAASAHTADGAMPLRAADGATSTGDDGRNEEVLRLLTRLIGNSILPLLYGFMGAAAAVGRDLWTKVRESLLSPRDFTLACMQLMLGVTMGACMGLFFHPGSGDSQDAAARSVILTASAISFLAGFGVEGVFQMLESLVKRVFNVTEPGKK